MPTLVTTFFEDLKQARIQTSQCAGSNGTCLIRIANEGTWRLTLKGSQIDVTDGEGPAELTLTCSRDAFLQMLHGEANPTALLFREIIDAKGNLHLFPIIQRLFPVAAYQQQQRGVRLAEVTMPEPPPQAPPPENITQPIKTTSILEGNTFVVSDMSGNINAGPTDTVGLFDNDTRHLSRWEMTVDGVVPHALSTDELHYYSTRFFLVPTTGTVYVDATISITRTREVAGGFIEHLKIQNHNNHDVDLTVRFDAQADFADLFEVKDALTKRGKLSTRVKADHLVLGYRREDFFRETWIVPDTAAQIDENGLTFLAHIPAHGEWTVNIDVLALRDRDHLPNLTHFKLKDVRAKEEAEMQKFLQAAPHLSCEWTDLENIYHRSLTDLAALRFFLKDILPRHALPAAGLPWFMTIFGRDSIITSFQALPFLPELAESTLLTLALFQGSRIDDFRDEEPGKIIHELRFGELAAFEERPQSPYFGAADTTPLFLVLLDEFERWTGNGDLIKELEPAARLALTWIDQFGDRNGDGYVDYSRRNSETGLVNQCWKDSWNSILFADGQLAPLPRATCEIQGYVYDAWCRCARLARLHWNDPALADSLEQKAADLKRRFNQDYWIADRQFYALALDGNGRQVDSLTSNIGHLLWSGIADPEKAEACVRHLMSDALFSGWGVRTMAATEGGYNPVGYHIGTVWPFDNAIIAWGLTKYGYREEAARIAQGIFEAATYFNFRLPEAFAGYPRAQTEYPVEYPTACSPQAWSTGAPLMLLRALLGLEPIEGRLLVEPHLPAFIGWLMLFDIPGAWGHKDAFARWKSPKAAHDGAMQDGQMVAERLKMRRGYGIFG